MSMPAASINTTFTLDALLGRLAAAPALPVVDITSDSRQVTEGAVFIACGGKTHHGLEFCKQAEKRGAAAIVYDAVFDPNANVPVPPKLDIPLIGVPGLKRHVGEIANRFFDFPSQRIDVTGVTGTNGKSTVAWLVKQCSQALRRRCGYAGTIGYGLGELLNANGASSGMTSPDVIETHRRLAGFRDQGATCAAIEVSSHALDQGRVDDVQFQTAMFTNLSRDHLDYHGDMQAYAEAKARLFTEHPVSRRIVNVDTPFGEELASRCGGDVIAVSMRSDRFSGDGRFVVVRRVEAHARGSRVSINSSWGEGCFQLPLPGDFNVANAVIVLAQLLADGVDLTEACGTFANVSAPPGRMQLVQYSSGPDVYIDYAHTPHALKLALEALRTHCLGRLWCVFGCGGDRDAGKRPIMGQAAQRLADRVVITNDNPRGESPNDIIAQIKVGLERPEDAIVIEDRATAIGWSVANAADDDVVLIAGKGHENYQIIGKERLSFSDFGIAMATLAAVEEGA